MRARRTWTLDALLQAYEQYQQHARGLRASTIRRNAQVVHLFVRGVLGEDPTDLTHLSRADVVQFIASAQSRFSASTMGTVATSLRSFFRFLRVEGLCEIPLEEAIPALPRWRHTSLPRGLSDEQYERLLGSLGGGATPCARRDRAIIVCLAALGLRPGEVAELCLEDIDWRAGTLHLRTRKTRRGALLPLPREVGHAIVEYLRDERPETLERRVFVRHDGSHRGAPISAGTVTEAVVRALRRGRIEAPIAGAYVLRHTVATRLVRQGTSLKEVADFLGHRDLDTTAIYAKVDLAALSSVALPWPEVTP